MSTETALLRAIQANPDEDTPRLMFADYLDEEGATARAEFIRVQIELAQLAEGDPRRNALEDREHELLAEHEYEWLGIDPDVRDGLTEWTFMRGFVDAVAASPFFMLGPGADLCAAHPIRRWGVQSGQDNMVEDLREAGQRGWFTRLEAVDLAGWFTTVGELETFLTRSRFDRLRELDLTQRPGVEALPEILGFTPFRDRLAALRCGGGGTAGWLNVRELVAALGSNCRLDEFAAPATLLAAYDVRLLLAAETCDQLRSLDLRFNDIAPDAWDAFRSAECRLRELDLSNTALGGISLDRLLDCDSLAELRRLHLNGCGSAMANLRALAGSRFWAQAEELRMQHGSIPEASLAPLFAATGPPALRTLDVAANWVRDAGVARLCDAEWAGSLTYLDLSQNYLSDEALGTIAGSGRFKNLRTLHLNFNSPYHLEGAAGHEIITDAGLRALADCRDLANLRVLSVRGARITATGVESVLNAPHWRLTGLDVAQCQLRPDAVEVLASSPRLARLEVLDLSDIDLDLDHFAPLTETEYLSTQTELNVRGAYGANRSMRDALRERLGRRLSD